MFCTKNLLFKHMFILLVSVVSRAQHPRALPDPLRARQGGVHYTGPAFNSFANSIVRQKREKLSAQEYGILVTIL